MTAVTGAINGFDCSKQFFNNVLQRIVRKDIELRRN